MSRMPTVLLIDDSESMRILAKATLQSPSYALHICAGPGEAIEFASSGKPLDLLVTDVKLPGMDGVELAQTIKTNWHAGLKVIYVTGLSRMSEAVTKLVVRGELVLIKPVDMLELKGRIHASVARPDALGTHTMASERP